MLSRCFFVCTFIVSTSLCAQAQSAGNVSQFGRNLVVERSQTVHNASCFLCSASVAGRLTGNLHVFAGNIFLDGKVDGNVLVFGGSLSVASRASVGGNVLIFGGRVNDGASTLGSPPRVISALIFLPLVLIICLVIGGLIVLARRMVRGPIVYPPLPRL
jgi:hypothetical protein